MIPAPIFAFCVLGALTAGLLIGWDWAVHTYRVQKRALEEAQETLETEIAALHAQAIRDPQRAWIDIGKTNVLIHLERLLAQLRATLEPPA